MENEDAVRTVRMCISYVQILKIKMLGELKLQRRSRPIKSKIVRVGLVFPYATTKKTYAIKYVFLKLPALKYCLFPTTTM